MNFIAKLYQNPSFPIYLGIIIVILIIVFFIVFMLGKKDEASSKKAMQEKKIDNAFEETSKEEKIEVPINMETTSTKEDMNNSFYSSVQTDNIVPDEGPIDIDEIAHNIERDIREYVLSRPVEGDIPETKPIEPEKPFKEEEYTTANDMISKEVSVENTEQKIEKYEELASSIEKELNELEQKSMSSGPILSETKEELLPSYKEEIPEKVEIEMPQKETPKEDDLINDTKQIELPKLK